MTMEKPDNEQECYVSQPETRITVAEFLHGHRGGERGFYPFLSIDIFIAIGRFSAGELLI